MVKLFLITADVAVTSKFGFCKNLESSNNQEEYTYLSKVKVRTVANGNGSRKNSRQIVKNYSPANKNKSPKNSRHQKKCK